MCPFDRTDCILIHSFVDVSVSSLVVKFSFDL